ncbi:hypothetical protein [Bradyrhizobium sp. Leo121]|uniref:hypothetical protein n=1 Tax=Bradyrhizobium sp. Leo121 TaxID=1571195 RepID=UPI001029EE2C|nr:hypothetical protein [Bradyrhizobium sp. Leo121]RZN33418.1 hypothetical protein CWO90_10070 [Bradyrhizobium sp. Leo121]
MPLPQARDNPLASPAHERPQPAANYLDIPQGETSKLDLGLQGANIPQGSGRDDKATDGLMKMAEGKLNTVHFSNPYNTNLNHISAHNYLSI